MLSVLTLLIVVTGAAVEGCTKTTYKLHGEECDCATTCLENSHCLKNETGNMSCQCLPCQYFHEDFCQCLDTPGLGESCNGVCPPPYTCGFDNSGNEICQECPDTQYFNYSTNVCVDLPNYGDPCNSSCRCNMECQVNSIFGEPTCGCSSASQGWDPALGICKHDCVSNRTDGCKCLPNGNYPACDQCEEGVFISCSNNILHSRNKPNCLREFALLAGNC